MLCKEEMAGGVVVVAKIAAHGTHKKHMAENDSHGAE
jgi:hypothetical protein